MDPREATLFEFHKKLRTLTFFDPACGCGNFLVISYRELRELELAVHQLIGLNVDQFYGIEIEEFGLYFARIPPVLDARAQFQIRKQMTGWLHIGEAKYTQ
jgi:hypothetical protein